MQGVGNYSFPSLLSTTKVLWSYKTFVVESRDGFELSDDNKFVETNGTDETNKDGSLEEMEAVQAATA